MACPQQTTMIWSGHAQKKYSKKNNMFSSGDTRTITSKGQTCLKNQYLWMLIVSIILSKIHTITDVKNKLLVPASLLHSLILWPRKRILENDLW